MDASACDGEASLAFSWDISIMIQTVERDHGRNRLNVLESPGSGCCVENI